MSLKSSSVGVTLTTWHPFSGSFTPSSRWLQDRHIVLLLSSWSRPRYWHSTTRVSWCSPLCSIHETNNSGSVSSLSLATQSFQIRPHGLFRILSSPPRVEMWSQIQSLSLLKMEHFLLEMLPFHCISIFFCVSTVAQRITGGMQNFTLLKFQEITYIIMIHFVTYSYVMKC